MPIGMTIIHTLQANLYTTILTTILHKITTRIGIHQATMIRVGIMVCNTTPYIMAQVTLIGVINCVYKLNNTHSYLIVFLIIPKNFSTAAFIFNTKNHSVIGNKPTNPSKPKISRLRSANEN